MYIIVLWCTNKWLLACIPFRCTSVSCGACLSKFACFSFVLNPVIFSGPNLNGLFGRQSGTTAGYSYSAANKSMAVIWGENTLYDYLLNPKKVTAWPGIFSLVARFEISTENIWVLDLFHMCYYICYCTYLLKNCCAVFVSTILEQRIGI